MPQGKFQQSHPNIKPPAYCWYSVFTTPLPLPYIGPARLHCYARWTDLDPVAPLDVSVYLSLLRRGTIPFVWQGLIRKLGVLFIVRFERRAALQRWILTLTVWDPYRNPEVFEWNDVQMHDRKAWESEFLHWAHIPGVDFRQAQVSI